MSQGQVETSIDESGIIAAAQAKVERARADLQRQDEQGPEPLEAILRRIALRGGVEIVPERFAGPYESITWAECFDCRGPLGYAVRGLDRVVREWCIQCHEREIVDRLARCGIGPDYRAAGVTFETFIDYSKLTADEVPIMDRARDSCRALADLRLEPSVRISNPFAFLCGENGTGKSMLGSLAVAHAVRRGRVARSMKFQKFLDTVNDAHGEHDVAETMLFYGSKVFLLVLHEVGYGSASDAALRRLFGLVDDRLDNGLPTIFTSNFAPTMAALGEQLLRTARSDARRAGEGYDDSIVRSILRRISDGSDGRYFVFPWKRYRQAAAGGGGNVGELLLRQAVEHQPA